MNNDPNSRLDRRGALRLLGGSFAALGVAGLAGCGGEDASPTPAASSAATESPPAEATGSDPATAEATTSQASPDTAPSETTPETSAETAQAAPADTPRLGEDDPQAQALGYRHDASDVDTARFASYQPGQACANCTLYAGEADDAWAPCPIFRNQQVNANGWCSAYVAKPQA